MRMLVLGLLAGGVSTMIAAHAQTTRRPGDMTEAHVWVENRTERGEAIPVLLESTARDLPPLRVRVVNGQAVPGRDEPVLTRLGVQPWEYRTVRAPVDATSLQALNALGAEGWDTTGVSYPAPADGARPPLVLLKRALSGDVRIGR